MIAPTVLGAVQILAGGSSLLFGGWWTLLSVLGVRSPRVIAPASGVRFVVLIPAHNEEGLIGRTVESLRASVYEPRPEVIVVADNCTDGTVHAAQEAGAVVVERHNEELKGKSYALDFGIQHIGLHLSSVPEVLVVVDADSTVNREFFRALAAAVPRHAVGQARYNAAPSLTDVGRLRRLAFGLIHHARPLGAQRLGLPTTLKGNGMAFRWELVRNGIPGAGITEDAAATLKFANRGVTVRYVPSAVVTGLMAEGYGAAMTQDTRWEGGRFALVPRALLTAAAQLGRGRVCSAAAAAELASPPLTAVAATAMVSLLLGLARQGVPLLGALAVGSVVAYVGLGLVAARATIDDLAALMHVPRFVVHKAGAYVSVLRSRPTRWQRSERGP